MHPLAMCSVQVAVLAVGVYLCVILFLFNINFQFLRDLDDEISAIRLEEESLKRKMNGKLLVYHLE